MPIECAGLPFGDDSKSNHELVRLAARTGGSWYNVSLADGVLYQTGLYDKPHFGNALSPYWFARSLAKLAGLDYRMLRSRDKGDWFGSQYFLKHLPTFVERSACPDLPALKHACAECHEHRCLLFTHETTVAYPYVHAEIITDTQAAYDKWMPLHKMVKPMYKANDVVIQDRCDPATLLGNSQYGPVAFRYYDVIANYSNVANIYIIRDPNTLPTGNPPQPFYPCHVLHGALCNYLARLVPKAKIYSGGHKDISADFAAVMYAPILFKGVSTFTMWGGLASSGIVYTTQLFSHVANVDKRPDFGPNWRYVDVPYLDAETAAKVAGPKMTAFDVNRILNWLMTA